MELMQEDTVAGNKEIRQRSGKERKSGDAGKTRAKVLGYEEKIHSQVQI